MSVIITGASGCVGRALLKNIPKEYGKIYAVYNKSSDFENFLSINGLKKRVEPLKCDLTDCRQVKKILGNKKSFEYCVFLAAIINIAKSIEDPIFDLTTNVIGLINFLSNTHIKRLIYMSSTSVYDTLRGNVGPCSRLEPVVPYGISKLVGEYYTKFFAEKRKSVSEYAVLRLSGAYGPYSPAKKIYNRIIKDFYFDRKNEITLFGDGKNLIDLLYVDEIARATILTLRSKKSNYTIDLCSGNLMTLNELIKKGASIFGIKNLRIKHTPFPHTEKYMTYKVSPRGAQEILNFRNKVNYEKGLMGLAEFYERQGLREWERR